MESFGQVRSRNRRQQVRRRFTVGSIHAHVEGAVTSIGKAALGIVDLHTRHAEVRQENVDASHSFGSENGGKGGEVPGMDNVWQTDTIQDFATSGKIVGIPI